MRRYYSVNAIRDAEAPLLASLPDGAHMKRAAFGLATEILRELVIYRANLIAAEAKVFAGTGSTTAQELAAKLYTARYDQLLREPKVQVDQIGGGAAAAAVRATAWRR